MCQGSLGGRSHAGLSWASSLGMALKGLGRFDAAENSIRRALALFEQCGADEWQIASALDNLGTTLSAAGRLQQAMAALEQARGILERHLGPDHLEVAWTWNHLGDVRYRLGILMGPGWPTSRR